MAGRQSLRYWGGRTEIEQREEEEKEEEEGREICEIVNSVEVEGEEVVNMDGWTKSHATKRRYPERWVPMWSEGRNRRVS